MSASLSSPSLSDPEALVASRNAKRRDFSNLNQAYRMARRTKDFAGAYQITKAADAAGLPVGRPAHDEEIMDTGNRSYALGLERARPRMSLTEQYRQSYRQAVDETERDDVIERAHSQGVPFHMSGFDPNAYPGALPKHYRQDGTPAPGIVKSGYEGSRPGDATEGTGWSGTHRDLNGGLTMDQLRRQVAEVRPTPSGATGSSTEPTMRSRVDTLLRRQPPATVGGVAVTSAAVAPTPEATVPNVGSYRDPDHDKIVEFSRLLRGNKLNQLGGSLRGAAAVGASAMAQKRLAASEADEEDFAQKTFGMSSEQALDPARVAAKFAEMTAGDDDRTASLAKLRQRQADYIAAGTPGEDSTKPVRSAFSFDLSDLKTIGGPALGLIAMTESEREKAFSKMDPATEKRMRPIVEELLLGGSSKRTSGGINKDNLRGAANRLIRR